MKRLIDANKCDTNTVSINCDPHDVQEWLNEQPTDTILGDIKAEIKRMKEKQDCLNTDYATGYISALSTVEGFIAKLEYEMDN